PVPVGGGEGRVAPVEVDIDAGQHRPPLVAGGGDYGLLDRVFELGLVDLDLATVDPGGDGWEVRRIDPTDGGVEPIAFDRQRLRLLVQGHRQRFVWMRGHEVGKQPRWDSDATLFLDLGRNDLADPDLQVGSGQLQTRLGGLQQDVVEDR